MEEQTIKLLDECSKGCKMGIGSIAQIKGYITDVDLYKVIDHYDEKYKKLDDEAAGLLEKDGKPEKEPGKMAAAFSWITTEMKLMIKDDSSQIAKMMIDGCSMGIKSISESVNDCTNASGESQALAKKLVKALEDFMKDLKQFV